MLNFDQKKKKKMGCEVAKLLSGQRPAFVIYFPHKLKPHFGSYFFFVGKEMYPYLLQCSAMLHLLR